MAEIAKQNKIQKNTKLPWFFPFFCRPFLPYIKQELKSLKTSASSIKFVANKKYVANKVFVANQVFIGNHVFVWKISWQYFGSDQSSIYLKDQLTILRHHKLSFCLPFRIYCESSIYLKNQMTLLWLGPIKYLPEISIDNTSAQANQAFVWKISWQYFDNKVE